MALDSVELWSLWLALYIQRKFTLRSHKRRRSLWWRTGPRFYRCFWNRFCLFTSRLRERPSFIYLACLLALFIRLANFFQFYLLFLVFRVLCRLLLLLSFKKWILGGIFFRLCGFVEFYAFPHFLDWNFFNSIKAGTIAKWRWLSITRLRCFHLFLTFYGRLFISWSILTWFFYFSFLFGRCLDSSFGLWIFLYFNSLRYWFSFWYLYKFRYVLPRCLYRWRSQSLKSWRWGDAVLFWNYYWWWHFYILEGFSKVFLGIRVVFVNILGYSISHRNVGFLLEFRTFFRIWLFHFCCKRCQRWRRRR